MSVSRWRFKLADHQFDIISKLGALNLDADVLSCNPTGPKITTETDEEYHADEVHVVTITDVKKNSEIEMQGTEAVGEETAN